MASVGYRHRRRFFRSGDRSRGPAIVGRTRRQGIGRDFLRRESRERPHANPKAETGSQAERRLWIVRPKGRAGISERAVMAAGKAAGLVDVKVVSFSATHTAQKFAIPRSKRSPRS